MHSPHSASSVIHAMNFFASCIQLIIIISHLVLDVLCCMHMLKQCVIISSFLRTFCCMDIQQCISRHLLLSAFDCIGLLKWSCLHHHQNVKCWLLFAALQFLANTVNVQRSAIALFLTSTSNGLHKLKHKWFTQAKIWKIHMVCVLLGILSLLSMHSGWREKCMDR